MPPVVPGDSFVANSLHPAPAHSSIRPLNELEQMHLGLYGPLIVLERVRHSIRRPITS
jgi:hypothetical protein